MFEIKNVGHGFQGNPFKAPLTNIAHDQTSIA